MRARALALPVLVAGLVLPFLGRPPHVDDPNFLALARGAVLDPWRPHDVVINWQGSSERAFDVLSNPPGVAWWLAPVVDAPLPAQHLWMLAWLPLALWGAHRLGRRFSGDGEGAVLLTLTSPVVLLACCSLTPDLPLLACTLAGVGGFVDATDRGDRARATTWALVAGLAALFRYSGLALVPLLLLYPQTRRRNVAAMVPAAASALPIALLCLHDLHAWGAVHILAMGRFQAVSLGSWDLFHKAVAAVAMVGAAGLLPVLAAATFRRSLPGAVAGLLLGLVAASLADQPADATLATTLATAAGGAVLAPTLPGRRATPDHLFLAAWTWGGLLFLLTLRFMAARYWLPFLIPVALVALQALRTRGSRRLLAAAVALQAVVALGMAVDDDAQARAQVALATTVTHRFPASDEASPPRFAGHWGWQHALETAGWRPLEEGEVLPPGTLLAVAETPWPQEPAEGSCLDESWRTEAPDDWPGPRVHTAAGRANVHAFVIAGHPPLDTFAPWTLASDPRERVVVWRTCAAAAAHPPPSPP